MAERALELIDARLAALMADDEYDQKTSTGVGLRRAAHELTELRSEMTVSALT